MTDHLEQQLVNELRHLLQSLNDTYKDHFHIQLITLCDMKDQKCSDCISSDTKCLRCVVGVEDKP